MCVKSKRGAVKAVNIRLENTTKSFGSKAVIKPSSLKIESGSFTTLLGPSGCGKTTLLRMIAGLETPDTGEIYFEDKCIFSRERKINVPPEKRGLGFVFQDFALWPHMTVFDNVAFGLRATHHKENLREKVMTALKAVKLEEYADRYPGQLSGGQQQRVAFARAIVVEPSCILFDEPLSALDALLREQMRTELKELISKLGITAVFVTHDQTEAMSMSDRIAVLHDGTIEQYDTPEAVYNTPATKYVAKFVGSSNWIDDDRMFRPEKASFSQIENAVSFSPEIISTQFLGNSYLLQLKYNERIWTIPSSRKEASGESLPVYIHIDNIINFQKEG